MFAKSIALALLFLGVVYAQFGTPSLTDLVPGATPTAGTLLPTLTSDAAEYPQVLYRLWVPENLETLTLVFSQTDSVCTGDIRYYIHADHIPCGTKWSEGSNDNYPCREAITTYFTDTSSDTVNLYPGSEANSALLKLGSWVYISMSRDVPSSDYAALCTYTITTTLTTCATAGQIGVNEGSSTATCKAHTDITLPYSAQWSAANQLGEVYHRVWVPENTAHLRIWANDTAYSTYFYGNSKYPGGSYYYECYDYASSVGGNYYEINSNCYNPPMGWYYIYFYTSSSGYYLQGSVSISAVTCGANFAGYNCTYEAYNLTANPTLPQTFTLAAGAGSGSGFPDAFTQFYYSYPNGTSVNNNFTVTITAAATNYVYYNRNGYIADDSDNYLFYSGLSLNTAETVSITTYDSWVGGNFYVAVSNEGTTATTFTLTLTSAAGTSTTGSVTGGDTGAATTGSNAVSVVASFALIAALIALLL